MQNGQTITWLDKAAAPVAEWSTPNGGVDVYDEHGKLVPAYKRGKFSTLFLSRLNTLTYYFTSHLLLHCLPLTVFSFASNSSPPNQYAKYLSNIRPENDQRIFKIVAPNLCTHPCTRTNCCTRRSPINSSRAAIHSSIPIFLVHR